MRWPIGRVAIWHCRKRTGCVRLRGPAPIQNRPCAACMRQRRPVSSPTHNSTARLLEMLAAGVPVRVGSDNVCDITSPAGTTDLVQELFVLANTVRFYDEGVLAKLGAGVPLDAAERALVIEHLDRDAAEVRRAIPTPRLRRAA